MSEEYLQRVVKESNFIGVPILYERKIFKINGIMNRYRTFDIMI